METSSIINAFEIYITFIEVLYTSHNEIRQTNSKPVSIQFRLTNLNGSLGSSIIGINITISPTVLPF